MGIDEAINATVKSAIDTHLLDFLTDEKLLTIDEISQKLNVSANTFRGMARQFDLSSYPRGKNNRGYLFSQVLRQLENKKWEG